MKILYKCSECGCEFDPNEQETLSARTINDGTPSRRFVCDSCFDSLWEDGKIVCCAHCGNWFEDELLFHIKSEEIGGDTFMPCPSCGHDLIEGDTREERLQNTSDDPIFFGSYAVTICYADGDNTTYLFQNRSDADAFVRTIADDFSHAKSVVKIKPNINEQIFKNEKNTSDFVRIICSRIYL